MHESTSRPPAIAPRAPKKPHTTTHHGITIADDYAWLRDPGYPKVEDTEVLDHLKAENAWFEERMAPHAELVDTLFAEMKARIKEDDSSVPQRYGDYLYWVKFEEGAQYPQHYRRPVTGGEDELLLDEVALAEGHEYFRLGQLAVTRDGALMAYATDTDGGERFTVRVKDLATGTLLPDEIAGTLGNIEWVEGGKALAYGLANEQWRTNSLRLHRLGTPVAQDIELYHEDDDGFRAEASLSAQEDWLILATGDHETSEVRLVPAADPTAEPILVRARQPGVEYDVDVRDGTIWAHTNDEHVNFRLATAPLETPDKWTTAIAGSDAFYLNGFALFADFLVTEGRLDGLDHVRLHDYADLKAKPIAFPEASYVAGLGDNPEYAVEKLRLSYQSMITPGSVYDYHVDLKGLGGELELLKRQEIPSGYFSTLYTTERLQIRARDGTMIPVSVMQRRDRKPGGPLHLYAYGAYGYAYPPGFSVTRLSLVNRGMAFAIAHIRGGDDLGRNWYLSGKRYQRWNTFTDFVDVAKGLIDSGHTKAGKISISGGSAGGQLMGVVANTDPELWGAVVADVPFVDCLNTMLDESLPLTPGEWPEWGDPVRSKQAFAYILSYSPYDQVVAQAYPPMLVTGGLNDPRVTYWEPAKWVARLREMKTDGNEQLLKINMGAGHGGKSGRFESIREIAEQYAFVLWQLGLSGKKEK